MSPDGRSPTRRSVLLGLGALAGAGVAGRVVRSAVPGDRPASGGGDRREGAVGLALYNADDAGRVLRLRIASGEATHLVVERSLAPGEAAWVDRALPAPGDPVTYRLAADLDGDPAASRSLVLGPPRDVGELHAVVREGGAVDLSTVSG